MYGINTRCCMLSIRRIPGGMHACAWCHTARSADYIHAQRAWLHANPSDWIKNQATRLGCLIFWLVLTEKMPLIFCFAKSFSPAIRTFCDAIAVKMDCNIELIPFWLEFGFAFRAYVCFGYHNHIQNDKQDNYGNGYKIPWNIKMTAKPINLTGGKHKSWDN